MSVKTVSHSGNAGFSLVEIAIVIMIAGLLLTLFTGSLMSMVKNAKVKTTQTRLKEIDVALRSYASNNNRLPCAASREMAVNLPDYAKELTSCSGPATGTQSSGGVRIGMVPTRTLNLPDDYGYDAWGSRLIYAVTENLTRTATYDLENGAISIVGIDATTSLITPANSGTYVVVSVGSDLQGAYNLDGYEIQACSAGTGLDTENCDDDSVFRDTFFQSDATGVNQFDDDVIYSANFQTSVIPAGAIMAFNLADCPTGWAAAPQMIGRFVMGAGPNYNESSPPPTGATNFSPRTYGVGNTGGWITRYDDGEPLVTADRYENAPPYVAYTYCQKR